MEFRAIFIANHAHLSAHRKQLVIRQENEITVPMEDISSVLVESHAVTMTAAVLEELSEHGVTVYFCDDHHLPSALLLPMNQHSRQLKMLSQQISMTLPKKKKLWRSVVSKKIENQAICLSLLKRQGVEDLRFMAKSVRSGDPDNLEATAAASYFPALFGTGFSRGEECRINAALNYGYAIIRGAVARNLVVHGLEPCLGIFHHSELNQFNLADDLMEPFRPLVDLFVASSVLDEEGSLTSDIKHQLFNLTNYMVCQSGRRYRAILAIGRLVQSFSRAAQDDNCKLDLPELLPLEPYRYE